MRAREFAEGEREEWAHMPSPDIARQYDAWDQEKRGRNFIFPTVPAPTPKPRLGPDSPFAEKPAKADSTPADSDLKRRDRYAGAPADEYKATAPTKFGGMIPSRNQVTGTEKNMTVAPPAQLDPKSTVDPRAARRSPPRYRI